MPKDSSSPFTLGVPVPVEFFVGRLDEVTKLRNKVASACEGRIQVGFLTGERGIGKSSLAAFVRFLTDRDHQTIGLHTFLGGVSTMDEMVRRVFDRLLKESEGTSWHEKTIKFFGNHVQKVGLFGISLEFKAPKQDLDRMANDFAPALRNLMESVKDEKKGLFLILDDINGLAGSEKFANWLKSLVDEMQLHKSHSLSAFFSLDLRNAVSHSFNSNPPWREYLISPMSMRGHRMKLNPSLRRHSQVLACRYVRMQS